MGYSIPSEGRKMNTGRFLLVGALILLFVACGGCSNGGDDPAEVVKNAVEALERLDEDKASEYFCREHEGYVKDSFAGASEYMGLSIDDVKEVLKFQFTDMKYEEKNREGDRAIVHVTGLAKLELNGDKYKELARKAIEAEGETISDEDLELLDLITPLVTGLNTETEVDGDVELIKEDGKWKVCDDFDIFGFP